ncbi:MAG: hypothetical protein QOF78_4325 [Phycisphaerales bacterium]|jgi:glycosyltransferase involved in cell wall biosynthesis|nr:hypothetical protein [Phycisphaerales bacterium]
MKVAICWGGVSGYMAACWRTLAARPGIDLLVFNFQSQSNTAFNEQMMAGLNTRTLPLDHSDPASAIKQIIRDHNAQVVSLSGWLYPSYIQLARDPELAKLPFVMVMDTPLRYTWRQRLARLKIGGYLDRMSRVIVPGERAWQYAKLLGVPESKIRRAMYGVDYDALSPAYAQRAAQAGGWPRRFLFTGRYADEKGIDVLLDAYARYRSRTTDPWPLSCCGMGPLKSQLENREGVEDLGFVQPAEMRNVMQRSGVFVLSSREDPWPLVIVEACAAGLPVVCTEACGSSVELVRSHYSGWQVATNDADDLARGLVLAHENYEKLPLMGRRAQHFAEAYSAQAWADRWEHILRELIQ